MRSDDPVAPATSEVADRLSYDLVVAASAVAAFGAAFSGVEPTGTSWWDPALAAALAVAFVVAATRAHLWAMFSAVAIATLFVGFSPWLAVSVAGCAALAASISQPNRKRDLRSISGCLTFLGLLHLGDMWFFGLSALLAAIAVVAVFMSAYSALAGDRQATVRRVVWWGTAVVAVLLVFAAAQALLVRTTANAGIEAARAGVSAARAGETQELAATIERAQLELQKAKDKVRSPLLRPLFLVPVAAQHLCSVQTATAQGLAVANEARAVAEYANIEEFTLRQGQLDLDLLTRMAPRLQSAATSLSNAVDAIQRDRSPWLVPLVDDQLQSLLDEVIVVLPEAQVAAQAARVMPQMLGVDGERRYLMLFGSPGEAREFGGFVGGYALIGVDDGDLDLIQAGSINDLVPIANLQQLDDPASYPVEYLAVDPALYPQNLTSTPSITLMARAVRDVFPELLGAPIDGVIYVDPYGLAAVTEITGPVWVPSIGEELVGSDIVDFIFDGQYRLLGDRADRFEAMGELAQATAAGFATTDLPGPETLGHLLGPVARAGRLQVVTYDDAENDFLTAVKLQRHFSAPTLIDAFAVIHTNGTASKLDLYLHRQVRYDVTVAGAGLQATVDVELRSEIPDDAPELTYGLTDGTNEVLLSLYSPHELTELTVNGQRHPFVVHEEFGFFRYALFKIPLTSGEPADVRFSLTGKAPPGPYRVGVWEQPGVNNDTGEIVYRVPGDEPVVESRELVQGWLFDPADTNSDG